MEKKENNNNTDSQEDEILQVNNEKYVQDSIDYAFYEVQGKRSSMEDAHFVQLNLSKDGQSCSFFGIYDGHGGRKAADYLASNLHLRFIEQDCSFEDPLEALRISILQVETEFLQHADKDQLQDGSTAVIAIIIKNTLYVANVGDAELSISRNNVCLSLTEIHNPSKNHEEITRVEQNGGRVYRKRVCHPFLNAAYFNIGVSRAIGDIMYKDPKFTDGKQSGLVADPFLTSVELDLVADDFIVMACDGLWDVMTHQEAVDFILETKQNNTLQETCELLVHDGLAKGSTDNITAMIITWKSFEKKTDSASI